MSYKLKRLIIALLLIHAVGSVAVLYFYYNYIDQTKNDLFYINVAGRQRLLTEQFSQIVHMIIDLDQQEDRPLLEKLIHTFDEALFAMEKGGMVMDRHLDPSPPEILGEINTVKQLWKRIKPALNSVTVDASPEREKLQRLSRFLFTSLPLLRDASNDIVVKYEALNNERKEHVLRMLFFVLFVNFVLILLDVTAFIRYLSEQKSLMQSVQRKEEQFRSVLAQSNDGIIVETGQSIVLWNPKFLEITGYTEEEISNGKFSFMNIATEEGKKVLLKREEQCREERSLPSIYRIACRTRDGKNLHLEINSSQISWENQAAILKIIRNVTYRIKAEQDLKKALERSEKASSVKDLFIANVSHEIRTPLNSLIGFIGILSERFKPQANEEEKGFFDIVESSGSRIVRTVQEILDVSQYTAGAYLFQPEPLNIKEVITQCIQPLKPEADAKGLILSESYLTPNLIVMADKYTLEQIIINLLQNAIQYTVKGSVTISVSRNDAKMMELEIRDTGIGISKKYQKRMFEPYTQESEGYSKRFQGIGLGLTIVKKACELNGIEVGVETKRDYGTTFTLTFPPVPQS